MTLEVSQCGPHVIIESEMDDGKRIGFGFLYHILIGAEEVIVLRAPSIF